MQILKAGAKVVLISLDREFTDASENELLSLFQTITPKMINVLILDFSDKVILDNTVINALVKLHALTKKTHTSLFAFGLNQTYANVFNFTGLSEVIRVCKTASEIISVSKIKDKDAADKIQDILGKSESFEPLDIDHWSPPLDKMRVPAMTAEAINLNVEGRKAAGPVQGFGQLWLKTYRLNLEDVKLTPEEVIKIIKSNFPAFQPPQNRFYPSAKGIRPGEIILINADTPGGMVATGVLVLYANEHTFTFITPQGHPEAGWVTFKASEENGHTVMQIQGLARASDFIYEIAFRIAGSSLQQQIWTHVLNSLAKHIGSKSGVQFNKQCLDSLLQWSKLFNVFQNAQIFSMVYSMTHPFHRPQKRNP
jgi:anti-anti-sigma regulatory factor